MVARKKESHVHAKMMGPFHMALDKSRMSVYIYYACLNKHLFKLSFSPLVLFVSLDRDALNRSSLINCSFKSNSHPSVRLITRRADEGLTLIFLILQDPSNKYFNVTSQVSECSLMFEPLWCSKSFKTCQVQSLAAL